MANPAEPVSKGLEGIVAAQTRWSGVRGDAGELTCAGLKAKPLEERQAGPGFKPIQ